MVLCFGSSCVGHLMVLWSKSSRDDDSSCDDYLNGIMVWVFLGWSFDGIMVWPSRIIITSVLVALLALVLLVMILLLVLVI